MTPHLSHQHRLIWCALVLLATAAGTRLHAASIQCVSTAPDGTSGNGDSGTIEGILGFSSAAPFVQGRVFFVSLATNLGTTPGADGSLAQALAKDPVLGTVELLTRPEDPAEAGAEIGDGDTKAVAVAADGSAWSVLSDGTNFMAPTFDTNLGADVFLWRDSGTAGITCPSGPAGLPFADGEALGSPCLSANGTAVVFASNATNLVDSDTNDAADIFLFDPATLSATLLSKTADGAQGNGDSTEPSMSADAQFVAFTSMAWNLVAGDTANGVTNIYLLNRNTGEITRVNRPADGGQTIYPAASPAISADGRFVAYVSGDPDIVPYDTNAVADVFVWDRIEGTTERVSVDSSGAGSDAPSSSPAISGDGRFVIFLSSASNLAEGGGARAGFVQVYVHDRDTHRTTPVSVTDSDVFADADCFAPWISADGRYITFSSKATVFGVPGGTHSQVYLVDRGDHYGNHPPIADVNAVTVAPGSSGSIVLAGMDPDGDSPLTYRLLTLPQHGDLTLKDGTPAAADAVVTESQMPLNYAAPGPWSGDDTFSFVALDPWGAVSDPASVVVRVSNFSIPFVDLISVGTDGLTAGSGDTPSYPPIPDRIGISASLAIVFGSRADNLVSNDANGVKDVFIRDYWARSTALVSASTYASGAPGDADSYAPAIAPDGDTAAFVSKASNLTPGDSPFSRDLFLYHRTTGALERIPLDDPYIEDPPWAALSEHGDTLVFSTESPLTTDDENAFADVYLYVPGLRGFERISISVSETGEDANGPSLRPCVDWTGTVIAFASGATNLVSGDTNGAADIFVYRADTGTLTRASTATNGAEADGESTAPALSMSGRYLAFKSGAGDLVSVPSSEGKSQIYVKNLLTGTVEMVSTNADGDAADADCDSPGISADGRYVCFRSAATNLTLTAPGSGTVQAWVKDRKTDEIILCSQSDSGDAADADVTLCAIAPVGRIVAFATRASNLPATADGTHTQLFAADLGPRQNAIPTAENGTQQTNEDTPVAAIPLTGVDADGDDLLFEIVTPPTLGALGPILSADPGHPAPTVDYAPAANAYGTDSFTFRCRDAHGWSEPATISIQVAEVNDPPLLGPVADQEVNETQTLTVSLPFTDADTSNHPPTDTWTVHVVSGSGEIVQSRAGFTYRYTPDHTVADPANPDVSRAVSIKIDDGRTGTDTKAFTVTVHDVNAPPSAGTLHIGPGAPVFTTSTLVPTYAFADIDGDAEGNSTVAWFVRSSGQGQGEFTAYTGPFVTTGDPSSGIPASTTVKHQEWYFTVTPRDARGRAGATVESPHTVIANSAPTVAVPTTLTPAEDTPRPFSVTASDADAGENLTLVLTQPAHGTVAESARRVRGGTQQAFQLQYSPEHDFFTPEGTPDTFTVAVTDGEATSEVQSVSVTVTPVNDPPVLTVLSDLTLESGGTTGDIALAPGSGACLQITDVDNDVAAEVTVRLATAPSKGTLTDNSGTVLHGGDSQVPARFPLTYSANAGSTDVDEIRLVAYDGHNTSQEVTLRVFLGFLSAQLSLATGWNLVSFPMQPTPAAPDALLVAPGTRTPIFVGRAWRWDADQRIYRPVTSLASGEGYWLYCDTPTPDLVFEGPRATRTSVDVLRGWNLVGAVGYGDTGILSNSGRGAARQSNPMLWQWIAEGQRFSPVVDGILERTAGYWLFSRQSGTVEVHLVP